MLNRVVLPAPEYPRMPIFSPFPNRQREAVQYRLSLGLVTEGDIVHLDFPLEGEASGRDRIEPYLRCIRKGLRYLLRGEGIAFVLYPTVHDAVYRGYYLVCRHGEYAERYRQGGHLRAARQTDDYHDHHPQDEREISPGPRR